MNGEIMRADKVFLFVDRRHVFWSVRWYDPVGVLSLLIRPSGKYVDYHDEREQWEVPLRDVTLLADPPRIPLVHNKTNIRIKVADRQYVVDFLGKRWEQTKSASDEVSMGWVQTDLDPIAAIKGLWSIKDLPAEGRAAREACTAWKQLLTQG